MPRFTIRDLLWLMVIVSIICGYSVNTHRLFDAGKWLSDRIGNEAAKIGVPLMGRDALPADSELATRNMP